jgi:galactose mutarotase-like enzyme
LQNTSEAPVGTSLGEHFYFALPGETTEGLSVDGFSLDSLLQKPGAAKEILQGTPYLWDGFDGSVCIEFPGGTKIRLRAEAAMGTPDGDVSANDLLGMLIWHRKDTESICFEPVVGLHAAPNGADNEGLAIAANSGARLATVIELISR